MRAIGNFLWFVMGGFLCGLLWWAFGVLGRLTIVGIPFAIQPLKLAGIALAPLGKTLFPTEVADAARCANADAAVAGFRRGSAQPG